MELGFRPFDADNHYYEPLDAFTRHQDPKMRRRGVQALHPMTSARAPKYLPESLLHYMRTRGKMNVIFASDAPVLSITRTIGEAMALDLPDQVRDDYLYGNAQRFFFDRLAKEGTAE